MIISQPHRQALERLEALDFLAAEKTLQDLHAQGDQSWIVQNDLALCRFMLGEEAAAAARLDELFAADPANSFVRLNRFYVAAAAEIRKAPPPDPRARIKEILGKGPERALITVVMPTFNRAEMIHESLESVKRQTLPDWELIVVNDGGERAVEQTLAPYLADPRLRYVFAEHGGLSAARNVGLVLAKGEFITQLDDDDVFYPEHLETVANAFRQNPEIKVVYTDFFRAHQELQGREWVTKKRVLDYSKEFSREAFRAGTYIPVCNLTQHRESLTTVGYYNERILRAMDWDYFTRLSRRYDFLHVAKVTGEFRQKADRSQMTRSFAIPRNYYRNLVSYLNGFFPLTGARFLDARGQGEALRRELSRLLAAAAEDFFVRRLELRKLLAEPAYALFYTLGKRSAEEGFRKEARRAFRSAAALRPYELKTWLRWLRP